MLDPKSTIEELKNQGITFFTGVPDSLLKDLCACLETCTTGSEHIIAANEGAAIALASGHYLGSGSPAVVYMQNSGLGNAINPLVSLASNKVYSIPMLLIVGWRGEPGIKDEPQHQLQGEITPALLDTLDIPYVQIQADTPDIAQIIKSSVEACKKKSSPHALLISKASFSSFAGKPTIEPDIFLSREEAIEAILKSIPGESVLVSTTGKTSRELFELRVSRSEGHDSDFLTVGSMGHASQIALGLALAQPELPVVCLDGDGSMLMHLGSLAITGDQNPSNFIHIVLNNAAHDSVGGQPTVGDKVNFCQIALACNYNQALRVGTVEEIKQSLEQILSSTGPNFLEIRVKQGARSDLGRPTNSPAENKRLLMDKLLK